MKFGPPQENVEVTFQDYGPSLTHNLLCWVCGERKAIIHMGDGWHFTPCEECQKLNPPKRKKWFSRKGD